MKINREQLPMMSVLGEIDHPSLSGDGHWVGHDGYGRIAMSVGGIVYNYALLVSFSVQREKPYLCFMRRRICVPGRGRMPQAQTPPQRRSKSPEPTGNTGLLKLTTT